jgi:hypothetical protein
VVKPQHSEGIETDDAGKFLFMHAPDCGGGCDYACAAAGEVIDGHIGWTPWGSNPKHWGRLWVKEAVRIHKKFDKKRLSEIGWVHPHYEADGKPPFDFYGRPRLARYVPRRYSRITLELTGVRVERLQEITGKDVAAEGFPFSSDIDQFKLTWNSLNAKRGYSWESNCWVWVLDFKRITP